MDPLYVSLANVLRESLQHGTFKTGERMPGVRALSAQRGVSVATAVTAYRQLEQEGWLEARDRSGFYVRPNGVPPAPEPRRSSPPTRPRTVSGQELVLHFAQASQDPRVVNLGAAVPAATFLPMRALERALADAARDPQARAAYAFPPGDAGLRHQIARRMSEAGAALHRDDIVITSGCQEALTLALRAVTKPGDVVAIESPTFYGLLQVIESLGLEALEIPTHPRQGISLEALELALERWPVKACVAVPNFSNPLGYRMSDVDKFRLTDLLKAHDIPLIEDDIYGDLSFVSPRPRTCKGLARGGDVLYCASFSKTVSPGLRVGWIAPGRHLDRVEYLKFVTNLATPSVPQVAMANLLASGRYERHLRTIRRHYAMAVSRMTDAVMRHFPDGVRITQPDGGFVIWVELPRHIDSVELAHRALEDGVSVAPGPIFSSTQKYKNFIRINCACVWDARVERALATLARLM